MMLWERPYMVRCVDALEIDSTCSVLEVGFGCGYSAERIQRARPRSHTIIECAEIVLERLRPWAAARPGVAVVEGTWQRTLPSLGVFDRIFFDDFGAPGLAEAEMEECDNEAYRARYAAARSHMHAFLDMVLEWHAQPGTKISGYLSGTPVVLKRSDTHYSCQRMPVRPPAHCHCAPLHLDPATSPRRSRLAPDSSELTRLRLRAALADFDDKVAIVPLWVKQAAGSAAAGEAEGPSAAVVETGEPATREGIETAPGSTSKRKRDSETTAARNE